MKPELSVIIASYNAEKTIEACLMSLKDQAEENLYEVIVVDSSTDKTPKIVENGYPDIRLIHFNERKFCGDARNTGIDKSRGDIIAFLDADCRAEKNWVQEILKAHQSTSLAIGGIIDNANPNSYVGWAAYFCEFSQWMPGTPDGWMDDIAGTGMSYKKEVFSSYGAFIKGTYCSDTHLHWRLREVGHQLRFNSALAVYHHNIDSLTRFLRHEFLHGHSFARIRFHSKEFDGLRRICYVLFSPLIPFRICAKVVCSVIKSKIYFNRFLRSLPFLITGIIFWSIGEAVGYIEGKYKYTA